MILAILKTHKTKCRQKHCYHVDKSAPVSVSVYMAILIFGAIGFIPDTYIQLTSQKKKISIRFKVFTFGTVFIHKAS